MPKKPDGQGPEGGGMPRDVVSGEYRYQKPRFGSFNQGYEQPKDRESQKDKPAPRLVVSNLKISAGGRI